MEKEGTKDVRWAGVGDVPEPAGEEESKVGGQAMKHPKNLTYNMKIKLKELGLNPLNWQYIKNMPDGLLLIHKMSGKTRKVKV